MQYLDKAGLNELWKKIKGQFQEQSTNLTNILATSGTGFLKKGANDTWTIDTNTYLTEITSELVTTALGYTPINSDKIGANNGLATLDANGKVPSSQLPSYVDDVLEYTNKAAFPTPGETGKIYVDKATNLTYRWGGSTEYVEISPSLALGETSSTAYAGDKGKANATAISTLQGYFTNGQAKVAIKLGTETKGSSNQPIYLNAGVPTAITIENGSSDVERPILVHNSSQIYSVSGITANYSKATLTATKFIGALQGNADTATKLKTSRTLWGVSFDGSADVTTAPNLYIGTTQVQTSSAQQNLSGIGTLGVAGVATFSNTTESTSATTGAVKISGGLGVAKRINAGGDIAAQGGVSAHGITDLSVSGGSGSVSQMRTWDEYEPTSTDQVLGANLGVELHNGKADKVSITAGTAGTSSATSGASIAIPFVTINNQGLVTNYGTHTHTLGSAATKTAGTANGNVPLLGAAASTTANTPAVFNASGNLVPHSSGALGSAAFTASSAYLASNHAASGVTTAKISNWDSAYGWGNHANAGYLKSVAYNDLTTKPTSAQIQALVGNYITTFGTKTGAITLRSGSTTRGDVNFSMSNNELRGTVYLADWAKAANKPSYDFSELGNKPTTIRGYGIKDAELELTKEDTIVTAFALTLGENVVTVGAIPISEIQALS